ncbi:MAG: signal peptidase I [Sulfurovaceae bacterium]|nr:signal peptidase I [Sulfurovaceae bacterium]
MKKAITSFYRFSSTWTGTIVIVLFLIFFVLQSFVIPSGSMKRTLLIGDFLFAKKYSYGIPIPHLPWVELPLLPDFNDNGHLITGDGPQRGDIVIFRYPKDPKIHYVKRCVATGGDEIIYIDKALFIRPHEGDAFIKQNYKPEQLITLQGKLWVRDPYIGKYPGVGYNPEMDTSIFEILLQRSNDVDMKPIFVEELNSPIYTNDNIDINALYTKVPKDNYYMMGDNRENSNDSRFWGPVPYANIVGKPMVIYFSMEFQSYETLLGSQDGGKDHAVLKRACGNIDIASKECKDIWDRERFRIRWDRVGRNIESLELEAPIE